MAGKGYRYKTRLEAWQSLQVFMKTHSLKRIDVGIAQVNPGWNGDHFTSTGSAGSVHQPQRRRRYPARMLGPQARQLAGRRRLLSPSRRRTGRRALPFLYQNKACHAAVAAFAACPGPVDNGPAPAPVQLADNAPVPAATSNTGFVWIEPEARP